MNELVLGLLSNLISVPIVWIVSRIWALRKARSVVWPVDIRAVKVSEPEASRMNPDILVATFSGVYKPAGLDEAAFRKALLKEDLTALPIDEGTPGIGSTIRAIKAYPTLRRVYLITTRSRIGHASAASVGLLARYCSDKLGRQIDFIADGSLAIDVDEDQQVINEAFNAVKEVFKQHKDARGRVYRPEESRIIVDVTGGTMSMSTGAILACLRPDQDIHLIGSRYDKAGKPVESFPLLVSFKPDRTYR